MIQIKPPNAFPSSNDIMKVFLAGSIEMGNTSNWQEAITNEFAAESNICFLNPRRDDWDSSWKQEISNDQFYEQVTWELDGLELADLIVFYFAPDTKSPISLLELGLFARTGKLLVCCPTGFWRKGNIDIVCKSWNIQQVESLQAVISEIKQRIKNF